MSLKHTYVYEYTLTQLLDWNFVYLDAGLLTKVMASDFEKCKNMAEAAANGVLCRVTKSCTAPWLPPSPSLKMTLTLHREQNMCFWGDTGKIFLSCATWSLRHENEYLLFCYHVRKEVSKNGTCEFRAI